MVPFSSVSGSLVPRSGNSIALRKSGGNGHSSDLSNENENQVLRRVGSRSGWTQSLPLIPRDVNGIPILKTRDAQTKYSDGDLRTAKELVSSSWESGLVLTASFSLTRGFREIL